MITISTPTDAFMRSMDRYMQGSQRPREKVMRIQARGILKTVISITPPSDGTATGATAKKKGEQAIESDLKKIFRPIPPRSASTNASNILSLSEMRTFHQSHRGQDGRVTDRLGKASARVTSGDFASFLKEEMLKVGYLVSGWAACAKDLGVSMPAWMTRNHAPSRCEITSNSTGISIRATNAAPFAGNVKDLQRRLSWAVNSQQEKIERQIVNNEERLQKEAGLR